MPWLNDWVVRVAQRQKQVFSEVDYEVLENRNISKKEHLFMINRLSNQLTSISEILSFFGCVDAAQKINEAVDELAKVGKYEMPVIRRRKKNVVTANSDTPAPQGAQVLELHEERSS